MTLDELRSGRLLLLGFGREGQSSYRFLRKVFPDRHLLIADSVRMDQDGDEMNSLIAGDRNITGYFGKDYLDSLLDADIVVRSPGISPHLPKLAVARANGVQFTSATSIFFENFSGTIVGITGTKGKSTTSALTNHLLSSAGFDSALIGNIGIPPLDLLTAGSKPASVVFELSSFQLEDLDTSPHIGVLLNIYPEHTDHHLTFENYQIAKLNIARFQKESDLFIRNEKLNLNPQHLEAFRGKPLTFSSTGLECASPPTLSEPFNRANIAAAWTVCAQLGVSSNQIARALETFQPLPHRLEFIGEYKNIGFYNASLATIPEATVAHIEALSPTLQTLIVGGFDRGQNFSELCKTVVERNVENVILLPPTGERIDQLLRTLSSGGKRTPRCFRADTMEQAVREAYQHTQPRRTCLLSPASPIFGMFRDYQHRGGEFRRFVERIGEE